MGIFCKKRRSRGRFSQKRKAKKRRSKATEADFFSRIVFLKKRRSEEAMKQRVILSRGAKKRRSEEAEGDFFRENFLRSVESKKQNLIFSENFFKEA